MNKEIEEVIKCFSSSFVNSGLTTYTLTEEKK